MDGLYLFFWMGHMLGWNVRRCLVTSLRTLAFQKVPR
jgi:hypothetical protein